MKKMCHQQSIESYDVEVNFGPYYGHQSLKCSNSVNFGATKMFFREAIKKKLRNFGHCPKLR